MFDKQYDFYGKYADYADILVQGIKTDDNYYPFRYLWELYLVAPIIGFQYKKEATCTDKSKHTSIFAEQLITHGNLFKFTYQLIMLLDENYESDFSKRIEKAFKIIGTEKAKEDEEHYDRYVLGGIEVLYEKFIEKGSSDSLIPNIMEFLQEYNSIYNISLDEVSVTDLIKSLKE